jgi:molecular chaperone GrpE
MWRSVIDWVLADVYPFEQEPCPIYPGVGPSLNGAGSAQDGLFQSTAMILAEHEALMARAQELESRTADPEELGRVVKGLLPVLDGIERVLDFGREATPSAELNNWLKSIEVVYYRLLTTLERQGLKPMEVVGKLVDLNCQEVVEYIPSKEHGHDHVVSERLKGYRFRGKLIRDAKVVVAYNPKDR